MKSYDLDYSDNSGGSTYTFGQLHCSKCESSIDLNNEKYFSCEKLPTTLLERIKKVFGIKLDTETLCTECHRDRQINEII